MDTKGKAVRDNLDLAYDIYCDKGGNVSQTIIELERRGLRLSRPTMDKWITDYRFKERFQDANAERQRAADNQLTFEQRMMSKLVSQIEKYEKYLDETTGVDNQATYAYTNLLKVVVELSRKIKVKENRDPDELRAAAAEILESEYGIKRN